MTNCQVFAKTFSDHFSTVDFYSATVMQVCLNANKQAKPLNLLNTSIQIMPELP